MAIILSLISMMGWGISDFCGGIAGKKEDTLTVSLNREWVELIAILGLLVFIPSHAHPRDLVLGAAAGLSSSIALPTFFKLLSHGRMGVVAPVTGIVGAGVPVIWGLATGENPSGIRIAGMILAVCGIGLISMVKDSPDSEYTTKTLTDIRTSVLCGFLFGCYFVLIHHTSKDSGIWPNVMVSIVLFVVLGSRALITKKKFVVSREVLPINMLGAATDFIAFVVFTYATRDGLLSITAVISSLQPIVTAALGVLLLKEHLDRLHKTGLAVSILSLVLISAG